MTDAWNKWRDSLDHVPTADDLEEFAHQISVDYGKYMYKPTDKIPLGDP